MAALVASLEHLAGVAVTFTATDEQNASAIATLNAGTAGPVAVGGSAPPPPAVPADVRAPLPPAAGMLPEALSAAAHAGTPGAGEPFTAAWTTVTEAARDASQNLRSTVARLPETLDGPASTPAASRHLLAFADGLDHYADRGQTLVTQASGYASNLAQARQDIPTPAEHAEAQNRVVSLAQANAASGGRYAVPLANAVADKNQLNQRTVTGYSGYHANTDTATAGDDPGSDGTGLNPASPATPGDPSVPGRTGSADGPLSPENSGEVASMLPQMLPTVLGAAGGLVGGLMGAVTKVPETLMQAGTQAIGAATQGLSGLAQPKMDPLENAGASGLGGDPGAGGLGDMGGAGGGGDAPTTPAGGGDPSLSVAPTTGAPPTPAITPVGATGSSAPPSAGMGGMPMGMPMGGMGAMGGGPGGAGGGKDDAGRQRKVSTHDIPHTEDVTGRTDTNRLAAAAAGRRQRDTAEPPDDDDNSPPPDSSQPIVRRLTTRTPTEPT
ncbi:PPE domain-containing protein (plasmid) [Mycolicibacterium aichiense]|uniref:PPE domain-containing protein n=1 Tax=Mycolicibacterium aichiense TaxID=1799 RepID=UPI003D674ECC